MTPTFDPLEPRSFAAPLPVGTIAAVLVVPTPPVQVVPYTDPSAPAVTPEDEARLLIEAVVR